ncbi:MAG: 23S rRNA (uracil(1939)-C(5))-methyltransferase RlmD [Ruminococcaceae bacterium]|nr:23S rRNA (uracil(1939)-C(5))-methyltransferase RlmD [Oscillospiraceae bacterium]
MPKKNDVIELTIEAMSSEGSGISHCSENGEKGMAVFIPATAVGDRVLCRIVKVEKRLAYGRVEKLLESGEDRLISDEEECPVASPCGGCVYRHVTYEAELRYKWQRVADALSRIGGIAVTPNPIVGSTPERYRNKAQYPVANGEEGLRFGFYAPRSHRLVEQRNCLLQPREFECVLNAVAAWGNAAEVKAYNETDGSGLLRHVYIRKAEATGQIMVCLVCTSGRLPNTEDLVTRLRAVSGVCTVVVNINRADTNVVLGDEEFPLYGSGVIEDRLCGLTFSLSPRSFYQVNHAQAEVLYSLAAQAAALTGKETLLDLYCGTGTIGLSMANKAARLIGVEVVPSAVADARRNAERNGVHTARFLCADAGEAACKLRDEGIHPDVVVIDPPRKGCTPDVIHTIADMAPARVVYVSCDPATLARDLKLFGELGYTTKTVTPVDMFPRTAHVETVVLLSREKADDYACHSVHTKDLKTSMN